MRKIYLVGLFLLFGAIAAQAATPANGTISDANLTLHFSSGPHFVSNVSPIPVAQTAYVCGTTNPCDEFRINYALSAGYTLAHPNYLFTISLGWPTHANDFDVYVLDENGVQVGQSASSSDPEAAVVPLTKDSGYLTVRVIPFAVTGDTASGVVTLGPQPDSTPHQDPNAPRFHTFAAPNGLGVDSGEPSIGVNPKTNQTMFQAGLQTLRSGFDDRYSPAKSNWAAVESQITSTFSLDPISWTDPETGRTVVSQLVSGLGRGIGCSLSAFTNDDGANWTPAEGCGLPAGADHQTVGGGHFAKLQGQTLPAATYPNAVYYCAQAGVTALCSLSLDGGLTFGPGVPMYDLTVCGGLHGHVQVSPFDGTVYVPNGGCGTNQAVVVSENNGLSWSVRPIPQSLPNSTGFSDPGVAVGAGGTVYFGYRNGDGHAHVTISHDRGVSWESDQDVGALAGIQNIQFPTLVAGDDDRAAFAFLGTTEAGNYEAPDFKGVWYLYVAMTFDGGKTWSLTNATGDDPVQRGCIWMEGGSNVCRNMLDFMGVTKDAQGRVLVGFADGCTGSCTADWPNSYSALATVARQSGGRRLYKAYDPIEPAAPATLYLSGLRTSRGVELNWAVPDHNGSPITGYRVYRGSTAGSEQPISSGIDTTKNGFVDATVSGSNTPYYRVTAVNAAGESAQSNEVHPPLAPIVIQANPCETPGVTVATDASGDQTGSTATNHLDLLSVSVAEPPFPDGVSRLVFTIKVASLSPTPQPNGAWKASFIDHSGVERFVQMNTFNPTAVAFGYGHIEVGTGGTSSNVNDGALEPGYSGYSVDGTITLVVRTDKVNVAANDLLGGVHGVTQLLAGVTAGLLLQTDSTSGDTYRVRGSANCQANNPPVAVLNASPVSGTSPLDVSFDGSASYDNDANESIAGWTFEYGDGTAGQSAAIDNASHTYTAPGTYTATLVVTDARGKQSTAASTTITVLNPATSSAHLTGGGFLEGGFTRFNFDVRGNLTGSFTFNDDDGVSFSATSGFDAYSVNGPCTTFGGNATTDDGRAVHYSVQACDKATPGNKGDTFAIDVTGGATLSRSGPIAGGNIKKH